MLSDSKRFNVGYLSARTAITDPGRPAILDFHGGVQRVLTYGELETRLNRVASLLESLGLSPGTRVALLVGNRREFIEVVYGAMRSHMLPALVNTKLGLNGLVASLNAITPEVAIVEPECNPSAIEAVERAGVKHRIILGSARPGWTEYERCVSQAAPEYEPPPVNTAAPADLSFTSGTTGVPKGVVTSHRAHLMRNAVLGHRVAHLVGGPIRALVCLPIFHANGRTSIGWAFETGGLVVVQRQFEAREALQNISAHRINFFLGVLPAYAAMLKQTDLIETLDFSNLKHLLVGSAPSGGDVMPKIGQALGVRILTGYGATEFGASMQAPYEGDYDLASCGMPQPGVEAKLVDPDTGAVGNKGELLLRSEWAFDGYWGRPDLAAAKFQDGWYRSGDLFERDERGLHYFRGRTDEMFNVGGEKVYPTEVENILQRHPAVLSACVVAVTHSSKGEAPAAMVIAVKDATLSEDELKQFFLQHGPGYAHPRKVVFAHEFPVAATGKVDRVRVKALLQAAYLE